MGSKNPTAIAGIGIDGGETSFALRATGSHSGDKGDGGMNTSMAIEKNKKMAVRRLTPIECCRLQGFPDDYLDITFNGKPAKDDPKYRALGNSMPTTVMLWIGKQIETAYKK